MTPKPHELKIPVSLVKNYAEAVEIAEREAVRFFGESVKSRLTYKVMMEQDPVAKRFIGNVFVYLEDESNKEEQNDN